LLGIASGALLAGSGLVSADVVIEPGGTINVGDGSYDIGCLTLEIQGTFRLQQGFATLGNWLNEPGGTAVGGGGTLDAGGNWTNLGSFDPGTGTVLLSARCTSGAPVVMTGESRFNNLILTGQGATYVVPAGERIEVNNLLDCQNNTLQRAIQNPLTPSYIRLAPEATIRNCNLDGVRILQDQGNPPPVPAAGPLGFLALMVMMAGLAVRRLRLGLFSSASRSRGQKSR
jgi:hypothetical protein